MKVLFFGLGSIGKRYADLLKDKHELYAYRTSKKKNELMEKEVYKLEDAFKIKPDVVFITNPPHLHVTTALECAKRNIPMYIEKPISNSTLLIDKLDKTVKKNNVFTYVAYHLRFNTTLRGLKERKEIPFYFRVCCSSYLPDWRKKDYRNCYSSSRSFGGGVMLDLSHEFDYLNWLYGLKKIQGYQHKVSNLSVDCEDTFDGFVTCDKSSGSVHLDYFGRKEERSIELFFDDGYQFKLSFLMSKDVLHNVYKRQLKYFLNCLNNEETPMNNLSEAIYLFKKIMEVRNEGCIYNSRSRN